ncbi:MAG TPA: transketolase [Steroidobacteraceae bacterium]|nr:transketolase [Steroidobacteraceae bacterium]
MPSRRELANAIRALSMDAVQRANSGHPGMPMGMADIAEALWRGFLKHNPGNPRWPDRDRFVLSNGHGSMLLYSVLHLTGYPLGLDELRNFRQLGARTAGHPEHEIAIGVETTTGPLGQGLANAVGMALAEKLLAAEFNRPGHEVVDHMTWVFAGDGCLMEGISHEACSLAGTWGLGKLVVFYDDNGISIDGEVAGWFTDDTPRRFEAYGWQVIRDVDGHDPDAVLRAIRKAKREKAKPTLICCKTVIGYGAPNKQGKEECHGAALGADEVALARKTLNWPHEAFVVPDDVRAGWDARAAGKRAESRWRRRFKAYQQAHPELAAEYLRRMAGELPAGFDAAIAEGAAAAQAAAQPLATRQSSQAVLNAIGPRMPELLGGSADLTGSNNTKIKTAAVFSRERPDGRYLHYGVREFGMGAIMNGIALHGGFIPFGGTFLVFSDYMRSSLRMASIVEAGSIFVLTHDSIGLGEDGPTHQPVEHLGSLRMIPRLEVWRPCDTAETWVAWGAAIRRRHMPTVLALTRQALPPQPRDALQLDAIRRGGYVLVDCAGTPECILIATGSEVGIAVEAARELAGRGRRVRVVSMPATSVFDAQDAGWRDAVLPPSVTRRVAIEAGAPDGWWRYAGARGRVIGMTRFGASGKGPELFRHFGFTAAAVVEAAQSLLANGDS